MILMEQSLLVPCDESPISPETLKKQELFRYILLRWWDAAIFTTSRISTGFFCQYLLKSAKNTV